MNRLNTGVALALLISSSASAYTIAPQPISGQDVTYNRGLAITVSRKDVSTVTIAPKGDGPHGRMMFDVAFHNGGTAPINFGYENVAVSDAKGPVRLFTQQDIEREAVKTARRREAALAFAAGMRSYSASQSSTYSESGSIYGSGYSANYQSYGRVNNPALNAIAQGQIQDQTAGELQAVRENLDTYMSGINDRVLQITTVQPGMDFGGVVFADRPSSIGSGTNTVSVTITVGPDVHTFNFVLNK